MRVIKATNVHTALPVALHALRTEGVARGSRNGDVLMMPEPTSTVYLQPTQRVMFHPWRDANPFFHLYEFIWMLAGRNDIRPLARYAKQMAQYSDDGSTQNAAYGHRWRSHFVLHQDERGQVVTDQLKVIARNLMENRASRQEVLQIWDPARDLGTRTKDHACNLTVTFQIGPDSREPPGLRGEVLNMVVFCRSNDAIWGCYGANAVHFSALLEYVALRCNARVGTYTQVSVNLHAYSATADKLYQYGTKSEDDVGNPYELEPMYPYPLAAANSLTGTNWMDKWDEDARFFTSQGDGRLPMKRKFNDPFFQDVAWPMVAAHDEFRDDLSERGIDQAMEAIHECAALDWRLAGMEWLERRRAARRANDAGTVA